MILLRNFDFAIKYFDFKSKTEIEDTSSPRIKGWYKFVNGQITGLLVNNNNLYFLFGKNQFLIEKPHRILLKEKVESECEFILVSGNEVIVRFLFLVPNEIQQTAPFEYIDEDDFKWGNFIAKIINDEERKKTFVMNLMEF